jgi:hypothetical protein
LLAFTPKKEVEVVEEVKVVEEPKKVVEVIP